MSAGKFKDMNDCMNQLTAKYPNPAIRKAVCQRLMGETSTAAGGGNGAAANKKPPFGR